jgi:hypothetical protein
MSRAWLNLCSAPLAGLLLPAMLMAIPLDMSAFTTMAALSTRPSFMSPAI